MACAACRNSDGSRHDAAPRPIGPDAPAARLPRRGDPRAAARRARPGRAERAAYRHRRPGDQPGPDLVTRRYPLPAARLFTAITAVAATEPRTEPLTAYADRLEASFVVRSRVFGFPDVILLRVTPQGEAASTLTLHSSSLYGYSDFGVNRRRLEHWLARLETVLPP